MLEHLPDPSTKDSTKGGAVEGRPSFVEAAAGRLPLWMSLAGVQASSSKQQAASSKQQASIKHQAASIKQQAGSIKKLGSETLEMKNSLKDPFKLLMNH